MAARDPKGFIKQLAAGHRASPPLLLPAQRAALWFLGVAAVTTAGMLLRQEFRPGFAAQMLAHPALFVEVAAALVLTVLGAYAALVHAVPGERLPRPVRATVWIAAALFVAGLVAEFTHLAPESSTLGARPHCWIEVFVYGAAGTVAFVWLARRGWVRFSWLHGLGYGVAAIVPSALMQLACMYEPVHNILYHFLPILPVVALGLFLMRKASRRSGGA